MKTVNRDEAKHTPGPWELIVRSETDGIWGCIGTSANRDTFARVDCCNAEKEANARLMAAAPELLAWAIELLAQVKRDNPDKMAGIIEHVEKLIARAGGK